MKLSIQIIMLALLYSVAARAQNEDFEATAAGTLTSTGQVAGWTITSGAVLNACSVQNCCPNAPSESAIISAPNGYLDARVPYPIYSVFGSSPNNGFITGLGATSGNNFLRVGNNLGGAVIEVATKSIAVTAGNALLQLAFLAVLEQGNHACCSSPAFLLRLTNAITNTPLICPGFSMTPTSNICTIITPITFNASTSPGWTYNDWYVAGIDLSPYIGQVIVIQVSANDCTAGGHGGYAYIDAHCGPLKLTGNQAQVAFGGPTATVNTCGVTTNTLTAPAGLGLYSWAGPNTTLSENTPSMANQVFTTTTAGNYTLTMSPLGACGPITKIITVNSVPAASLTVSGAGAVCANSTVTLSVNGASSYTWSNGSNTSTMALTPSVTTLIMVNGINANGCFASTPATINVIPLPFITASGNTTVCAGSGASFIFSGAGTYSLNGLPLTGNTFSVIPANSTTYTLTGTGNACTNTLLLSVTVITTCANVWPGDANSDGIADNLDILELGLHINQSGAARNPLSSAWQSQFANIWNGTISNGKNVCHADCNGDGVINLADTAAIFVNYSSTHSFYRSSAVESNTDLYLQADQPFVNAGDWGSASLFLGDNNNSINLNGVAFTLSFDKSLLQIDSVGLTYPLSFLNVGNNLHFNKKNFANGLIYSASTHTTNNNITGNGKIATFYFKVTSFLNSDTVMDVSPVNVYKSVASGVVTPLTSSNTGIVLKSLSTGISRTNISGTKVNIYPNPANHQVNIQAPYELQKIEIFTVDGKLMMAEPGGKQPLQTLHLGTLADGMYLIKVSGTNNQSHIQKLVLAAH